MVILPWDLSLVGHKIFSKRILNVENMRRLGHKSMNCTSCWVLGGVGSVNHLSLLLTKLWSREHTSTTLMAFSTSAGLLTGEPTTCSAHYKSAFHCRMARAQHRTLCPQYKILLHTVFSENPNGPSATIRCGRLGCIVPGSSLLDGILGHLSCRWPLTEEFLNMLAFPALPYTVEISWDATPSREPERLPWPHSST